MPDSYSHPRREGANSWDERGDGQREPNTYQSNRGGRGEWHGDRSAYGQRDRGEGSGRGNASMRSDRDNYNDGFRSRNDYTEAWDDRKSYPQEFRNSRPVEDHRWIDARDDDRRLPKRGRYEDAYDAPRGEKFHDGFPPSDSSTQDGGASYSRNPHGLPDRPHSREPLPDTSHRWRDGGGADGYSGHYDSDRHYSDYDDPEFVGRHSSSHGGRASRPSQGVETDHNNELNDPSASVILLGLPIHVDDLLLRNFLEDMGASIDSSTVIMDRGTGQSKRYGFAKFSSVEHARAFVEPNYPAVAWRDKGKPGPDDGLRIKINYSQKSGGWKEDVRLTEDQRNTHERNAGSRSAKNHFYVNDGTRDIGSSPSQILLLRGLDPLTTEEEVVDALARISDPVGRQIADRGGIKRILTTKDRASKSSWGYCFVQFADVALATKVLASVFDPQQFPTGFRIGNGLVALSFCHENSFVPIYARSEWSFNGEGGQQLAYWDDKAFVSVYIPPSTAELARAEISATKSSDHVDADMEAFFSSIEAEIPGVIRPPDSTGVLSDSVGPSNEGPGEPAKAEGPPSISHELVTSSAPIVIALKSANEDSNDKRKTDPKAAKKLKDLVDPASTATMAAASLQAKKEKSDLIQTRKAAKNISKWNTKQQELKEAIPVPVPALASSVNTIPVAKGVNVSVGTAAAGASLDSSSSSSGGLTANHNIPAPLAVALLDEFEHGDPIAMICLLCQRQFKAVDELRKHNKLSALHKTNLSKPQTVTECAARKANSLKKLASQPTSVVPSHTDILDPSVSKYVDRAAARREAFNQPDHPMPDNRGRKKFEGPPPVAPPAENPNKNGIEETNVGAKMLEKMGWSKGGGLGTTGTGIVDPILAAQFQQGAGLGSTKGVVVGTFDATPKGYAEQLREKARQRLAESE